MTPTERIVASIYTDVLGVESLKAEDDIFEVGGDSLQAVRIALKLETRFDVEIPIETLEGSARICDVAALIDNQLAARRTLAAGAK